MHLYTHARIVYVHLHVYSTLRRLVDAPHMPTVERMAYTRGREKDGVREKETESAASRGMDIEGSGLLDALSW